MSHCSWKQKLTRNVYIEPPSVEIVPDEFKEKKTGKNKKK